MPDFRPLVRLAVLVVAIGTLGQALAADDLATLAKRVQVLEDREAIRALILAYGQAHDHRDYRTFSNLFASNGEWGKRGRKKAAPVNRIGAVSPAARSNPRITPVSMPGNASLRTIRLIVCQRVAPSEMLTVRNAWGTERNDSSAVLMMTGKVMIESVKEAARMDVPKFKKMTKRPRPNKP